MSGGPIPGRTPGGTVPAVAPERAGRSTSAGHPSRNGAAAAEALGRRQRRFLALIVAVAVVLWLARDILAPFVIAAVAAYAFDPVVSGVQRRTRLPRGIVILIGYAIVVAILVALVVLVAGRIGTELSEINKTGQTDVITEALTRFAGGSTVTFAGQHIDVAALGKQLHDAIFGFFRTPTDALHIAERAVDIGLKTVLTFIVTFYFLLDGHRFVEFSLRFLDRRRRVRTIRIAGHIHEVLGRWLRGQLLLIALVAAVLYVVLGPILHVRYALVLATMSGVLEIIPLVGPLFAASVAGIVAYGSNGANTAIAVIAVYFVVRQIEDQVVMPIVIGRAVHLHPVVTIFAVLVGLSTWGIFGGLLGVPVAAALNVTLHELYPEAEKPAVPLAAPAGAQGGEDPSPGHAPAGSDTPEEAGEPAP